MEYTIVWGYSLTVLVKKVNGLIEEGWKPIGGVSVAVVEETTMPFKREYYQAIIKEEKT